jgi:uncharacterized protein (TIGR03083 family)
MVTPPLDRAAYLDHLGVDIAALADALDAGPRDAPVPWCGEWTVADLGVHVGDVHRWATGAVLHRSSTGAELEAADPPPADRARLGEWLRAGGARLLDALRDVDLDAPTWHPFPVAKVGAVWPRRQAQETAVHRWDAEQAIGRSPVIDAALAADGIDEYFAVALPRLLHREAIRLTPGELRVRTTDTGDRWHVAERDGALVVRGDPEPEREAATATPTELCGPAAAVLLTLWRRPVAAGAVELSGPTAWLDLGGM